jgi:hypothetical protein
MPRPTRPYRANPFQPRRALPALPGHTAPFPAQSCLALPLQPRQSLPCHTSPHRTRPHLTGPHQPHQPHPTLPCRAGPCLALPGHSLPRHSSLTAPDPSKPRRAVPCLALPCQPFHAGPYPSVWDTARRPYPTPNLRCFGGMNLKRAIGITALLRGTHLTQPGTEPCDVQQVDNLFSRYG